MPILDKVAAANQINNLLKSVLPLGGFKLKYRITVNPPQSDELFHPEILVDFAGPDSVLLLERGGELLNALEHLSLKMLHMDGEEHDRVVFDCRNSKAVRREEIKMAASVAAERVRKSSLPYQFAPMNARERRMLHLSLAHEADLRTESQGEGPQRFVVLYPKDFKPTAPKPFGRRR